jgi:hypothetical protein
MLEHVSKTTPSASTSTIVGVVFSLMAQGSLLFAAIVYIFYGWCLDSCDMPERTTARALHAALPFGLIGLAAMVGACYLLMHRPRAPRPSVTRAWLMGVWFTVAYLAGIPAIGWVAGFFGSDNAVGIVIVVLFLIPLWTASHLAAARRAGRPPTDHRL